MVSSTLQLARVPTPIQSLPHVSREWGIDVRIKRDDLTGTELSGNKVRKLEYLLTEAQQQQASCVITCGATTSNHARATAIACRLVGFECHLILAGDPPSHPTGNLQMDLMMGARIQFVPTQEYSRHLDTLLTNKADELNQQSKPAYIIPTGGSNDTGSWGYVDAIEEIHHQCRKADWWPDWIICAVGSGGTYCGMLAGCKLHQMPSTCMGILVSGGPNSMAQKVVEIVGKMDSRLSQQADLLNDIHLPHHYIAGGYGKTNSEQLRFIRHVAQQEGIFLDPVYTGKAMYGLYSEAQAGRIEQGAKVLFLHTGGLFGLPHYAEVMANEWGSCEYWPDTF